MKIAILNITSGGLSGGYRKYLQEVIPRITRSPKVSDIIVSFPSASHIQEFAGLVRERSKILFKFPTRPGSDSTDKKLLEDFSPDVVFIPTARYFGVKKTPVVNMIRNMEPLVDIEGNPLSERVENYMRKAMAYRSVNRADRVIAVSNYVLEYLTARWGINPAKVGMVYHGVDDLLGNTISRPQSIPKSWDSGFLFTSGSIRPARGLEDALTAWNYLTVEQPRIKGLVISGEIVPTMEGYRKRLLEIIKVHNLSSSICWTGALNGMEMAWCYRNCKAFLMTSRVEACPNIALEAMSYGCLCFASDNPPMPEIFGNSAIFYPAGDGKTLGCLINRYMNESSECSRSLSALATKRASDFSWDVTVEKTIGELEHAIDAMKG